MDSLSVSERKGKEERDNSQSFTPTVYIDTCVASLSAEKQNKKIKTNVKKSPCTTFNAAAADGYLRLQHEEKSKVHTYIPTYMHLCIRKVK